MPIRLGFIGFGIMGERLARAAGPHGDVLVSGIYDPAPSAEARLRAIAPAGEVYRSAAAVIAASDALHIASPPASHLGYLEACAAAGRAVLCEKPLATDVTAASATLERLAAAKARAAVNFPFASSPAVEALTQWMSEGRIGTPQRCDIVLGFKSWPRPWQMDAVQWLDAPAEGGFLREVGSHFLFLSRRALGALRLDAASAAFPDRDRSERRVSARLHAGGVPVTLAGDVGSAEFDDHNTWTLTGSAGRIRLRDWAFAEVEVGGAWQAHPEAMANERARPLVLQRQLDKLAALTRGAATNLATLDEALDVQRVVEAVLAQRGS